MLISPSNNGWKLFLKSNDYLVAHMAAGNSGNGIVPDVILVPVVQSLWVDSPQLAALNRFLSEIRHFRVL